MFFFVCIIVMIAIIEVLLTSTIKKTPEFKSGIRERDHRFHEPQGTFETEHADRVGTKLVHHDEPTEGYVVLNGIKRKLSDCKNL